MAGSPWIARGYRRDRLGGPCQPKRTLRRLLDCHRPWTATACGSTEGVGLRTQGVPTGCGPSGARRACRPTGGAAAMSKARRLGRVAGPLPWVLCTQVRRYFRVSVRGYGPRSTEWGPRGCRGAVVQGAAGNREAGEVAGGGVRALRPVPSSRTALPARCGVRPASFVRRLCDARPVPAVVPVRACRGARPGACLDDRPVPAVVPGSAPVPAPGSGRLSAGAVSPA